MTLQSFNIIELSTAVMTIAGGIALILRQIQQSKCKTCTFCCGVSQCEREVQSSPPVVESSEADETKETDKIEIGIRQ